MPVDFDGTATPGTVEVELSSAPSPSASTSDGSDCEANTQHKTEKVILERP